MRHSAFILLLLVGLSACSSPLRFFGEEAPARPPVLVNEQPGEDVTRPRARLDPTGSTETQSPTLPSGDGFLGETLAGLGSPGETGLWLRTGLVSETRAGRIITETGQTLTVELRPSGAAPGAGSQLSLMAMQALGLNLGQLATLRVFVD